MIDCVYFYTKGITEGLNTKRQLSLYIIVDCSLKIKMHTLNTTCSANSLRVLLHIDK